MTTNQSELQTPKRLARGISFQEKLGILRQLEAGVSRKEICENFKCCQSTISRVLLTKQTILELAEQDKNLNRKRVAMVTYKDIDEALSKWAQEMKRNNEMITAALAKQKAEEIAREMGQEDFKPSAGWLYKWKERENVQFCKKPKVVDQLIASMGSEEILKGLLEKNEDSETQYVHKSKKMRALEDYNHMGNQDFLEETSNCRDELNNREQDPQHITPDDAYAEQNSSPATDSNIFKKRRESQLLENSNYIEIPREDQDSTQLNETREALVSPAKRKASAPPSTTSTPGASSQHQQSPSSALKSEPKKVLYSYDPVYVLTSTGRYRKEKTFLTLLQKLEILQRLKNGEKRPDLINEYRLSQSAMCQIIADEKKILKMAAIGQNLQMKRIRGGIFKAGESELNTWVLDKMDKGETLTRNQVKNKAKEIADRMKIEFKASTGWLEKWKARMNMDFNEKQILYRKPPQYLNKTDIEQAQTSRRQRQAHQSEVSYAEDDTAQRTNDHHQLDVKRELEEAEVYNMDYTGDNSIDIKPYVDQHEEQYYPEVVTIVGDDDEEEEDVKPFVSTPPHILPDDDSDDEEPIHQQILNWLNKYNIAPTAATELLTILHPVISDKPDAPQQTRLTITTKPASRSKGRPYAQHTYS